MSTFVTINHLLQAMSRDTLARIEPYMERVALPLGTILYEPGATLDHVYYPIDCIISILNVIADRASVEISVVGNEGVFGVSLFMGSASTTSTAVVQSAGSAYRLHASRMEDEFLRHGEFMQLMLRYTQSLITQIAQTAVCNRHHSIDQQLCRWLLHSLDRLHGNSLQMTQGLIANMLGVRREGVTEAAGKLQAKGAITYRRGRIDVLDRHMLEELSCECYGVVKRETDRLLPSSGIPLDWVPARRGLPLPGLRFSSLPEARAHAGVR